MSIKWPSKYGKNTNRHNEWSALKKKHAAAIKESKVDFEAGLGGAVDKFESAIKKVATAGYGEKATNADLEKVTQAGIAAAKVANGYKSKLGSLKDPAKKELTAFLAAIESDAKMWSDATLFEPTKAVKLDTKWAEVRVLAGHFGHIVKHGKEADAWLAADAALKRGSQELVALKKALVDLIAAAVDAEKSARHLEGLTDNAGSNPAYLKILKADTAKSLAGPFKNFQQKHQVLDALRHPVDSTANMHLTNVANAGGRSLTQNLDFVMGSLAAVIAAERSLKVD